MTLHNSAMPLRGLAPRLLAFAPALFAATLFTSALLMFAVQPMFTKMVLPRLGGSPSVWSVAMVFFQAVLLIGYGYAHLIATRLKPTTGALTHLAVLAFAATTLPISVAAGFGAPPQSGVAAWLVGLFGASIGLPFAALSASAPLLQNWFSRSGHAQAANPYVLYAASNLGSFAGLIAYPLLIEPFFTLRDQALAWSLGFALLSAGIALCAVAVARASRIVSSSAPAHDAPIRTLDRLTWVGLAAIPAGLVIAVTAYIATDVASAPFLWVVPLALYLLTFVGVFRDVAWVRHETVVRLAPFLLAPLAISMLGGTKTYWFATMALNLVAFLVIALLCHGELYRRRPSPRRLTEFYLWTSTGGVIGGAFAGLAAPYLFSNIYEYPILIAAAALALPGAFTDDVRGFLRGAWPFLAAAPVVAIPPFAFDRGVPGVNELTVEVVLVGLAGLMLWQRGQPARLFGLIVLAFVVADLWRPGFARVATVRSFFGVHQVIDTQDGQHRILMHGTTIHGVERVREADRSPVTGRPEMLAYYYKGGPIDEAVSASRVRQSGLPHVAAIGLGSGTLACHSRPGETWHFFEIDPEIVRLARDPNVFRFLSACAPDAPITLGDGRLTLAASAEKFDLILLDAFSSDAIPAHLLTREAIAGYMSRANEHAIIVANISNRHMDLVPLMASLGAADGMVTFVKQDTKANRFAEDFRANAVVAVLARNAGDVGDLLSIEGWHRVEPDGMRAWTDDYSNMLAPIWRKKWRPAAP